MIAALALAAGTAALAGPLRSPWKPIAPGVESATVADVGGDPNWAAKVVLVEPHLARFAVRFDRTKPTISQWRERFPAALAIANGSFYSTDGPAGAELRPTCDLVAEGKRLRGAGCQRQDALFFGAVPRTAAAASVTAPLPRFVAPPQFRPDDWAEALKSFPALVRNGSAACSAPRYCAESSRTAAVGQLRDGRVVLFASQWPAVRRDVAQFLAGQLGATDAVNLDGGPEATLAVRGEPLEDAIGTYGRGLPLVVVVLPP
jgi:Phosphodiester glycosidase